MRGAILSLSCSLLLASFLNADETTYTIKLKLDPDVGKTVACKFNEKSHGFIKVYDGDKLILDETPEGEQSEIRTTVLEKDAKGQISKMIRHYGVDKETKNGKTTSQNYEGSTVLTERVGEVVNLGVAGTSKLTGKDVERLVDRVLNTGERRAILENLAPKKAVKVGESWMLDSKTTFEKLKEEAVIFDKTTVSVKLLKVVQKGKTPVGVIEYDAKILFSKAKNYLIFNPPGSTVLKGTIEIAIDGSSTERVEEYSEEVEGKGTYEAGEGKGRIEVKGGGTCRLEVSAEKDDAEARKVPKVTWLAGPNSWTEFTSKDHAFKALFPGKPQLQSTKDERGYPTTQYVVSDKGGEVAYIIAVTVFPDDAEVNPDLVLGALEKGPDVKAKEVIRLNGFAGREFKLQKGTKDKPIDITQRVYVVKQRMYQALYVESASKHGDMKKFFEGFRFNDKQNGKDD